MKTPSLLLRRFVRRGGNRGIAVIYIALLLVVLLAFVGLAVDLGYMYLVKTQLQNAADSAALAGSSKLSEIGSNDIVQLSARAEAISFASKNTATKIPVSILSDSTNAFNDANDITVGYWDGTSYTAGKTPINAIEVRTRRTPTSPDKQVSLFFGRILGWDKMSASAVALAGRGNRGDAPITICIKACGPTDGTPVDYTDTTTYPLGGKLFYWAPYPSEANPDGSQGVAWTSFSETSQATDKDITIGILCGATTDVCGKTIYSTNSNDNELARQFRCAFKNPDYDSLNKTCSDNAGGVCGPTAGRIVKNWTITAPIYEDAGCPPGSQPKPYKVIKWSKLRVIEVYASGGGGTNKCPCQAYDAPKMTGSQPNAILVDQVTCIPCDDTFKKLGNVPKLLK
jgi:Flp pilus assembly protein TadG